MNAAVNTREPYLDVRRLSVSYRSKGSVVRVVDRVNLSLAEGQALGIVGESGSGKSTFALAAAGLLRPDEALVEADQMTLAGKDLLRMSDVTRTRTLGKRIGFVFQNPHTALNPLLTIGHQLTDHARWHLGLSREDAERRAATLLGEVGIGDISRRMQAYPHEFSGGMLQRVTIAMALACDPGLLIADEPTTALDASVQADIVELVTRLRHDRRLTLIWITHDLALLRRVVDRVAVMYAGQLSELGATDVVYSAPAHPYTRALLSSVRSLWRDEDGAFEVIPGAPPTPGALPPGCAFQSRCPWVRSRCNEVPALLPVDPLRAGEHLAACWAISRTPVQ